MAAKDADLARDFSLDFVYVQAGTPVAAFEVSLLTTPQQSLAGGNPTGDRTEELFLTEELGTVLEITLLETGAGEIPGALPVQQTDHKSQFSSTEVLEIILNPFINSGGAYITTGLDTISLVLKAPDGTIYNPSTVWDSDVSMWLAQLPPVSFQEGEWLLYASSDGTTTPQFVALWWGDYVDDIIETRQAALGRWKIDGTVLSLYEDDGVTVFKSFDLRDAAGDPSATTVFDKDPI